MSKGEKLIALAINNAIRVGKKLDPPESLDFNDVIEYVVKLEKQLEKKEVNYEKE